MHREIRDSGDRRIQETIKNSIKVFSGILQNNNPTAILVVATTELRNKEFIAGVRVAISLSWSSKNRRLSTVTYAKP